MAKNQPKTIQANMMVTIHVGLSYISSNICRVLLLLFILSVNCFSLFAQEQNIYEVREQVYQYYQVDELPQYKGSSDFEPALNRNLEWPDLFHGEGRVILSFVVSDNGTLRDIQILRGLCEQCDEKAINALSKLNEWKPGESDGQAVSTRMYVSVNFRIQ